MAATRPSTIEDLKHLVRERTREVQILHRISESISSTLELETVLKQIVEVVVEVTKGDACLLYLISEQQTSLYCVHRKIRIPVLSGAYPSVWEKALPGGWHEKKFPW